MVTIQDKEGVRHVLVATNVALEAGDVAAADRLILPHLDAGSSDPALLHRAGLVRMHQQRFADAVDLFARARAADPGAAPLAFSHGTALRWLERPAEAVDAFRAAIALQPNYAEAYFEAGTTLKQMGALSEAEKIFRTWLTVLPGHVRGLLALADLLLATGRPQEAETVLRSVFVPPLAAETAGLLHQRLGLALRRQNKNKEALEHYEKSAALDPDPMTDGIRTEILQDLKRYDEAAAVSAGLVARHPDNPAWHKFHNDLMYRLRREDYLKSYDRAPRTAELLLSKAYFLSHGKRAEEAFEAYSEVLKLEPANRPAVMGLGNALNMMKRHAESRQVFEAALARHGEEADLLTCAAEAAILSGDAEQAVALCEKSLRLAPHDQAALAILGTSWRLLEDDRDEILNGYESLIQVYDLKPPEGFADMETFNAELNAWLDGTHPATREYLDQTLRNGTQTPDQIFGRGHELVETIRARIDQALERYIAGLIEDDQHPFLSRRARNFRYSGSWSSRLRDCGFHVNHIHPRGWISSCYYVAVPNAVENEKERQGWIKFGEPGLDVALKEPVRRAIQPRPGRLVLFPSYMWHGTVPFHDTQARTTIAFDAVPKG